MEIEEIGKGIDELHQIARQANEEIKIQNKMLDVLEEKVNDVGESVQNVNEKLKVTLEKARASDKICMVSLSVGIRDDGFDENIRFIRISFVL